ncbi:site-2 protease family protein [Sporosarcina sp. ZBG7A]|uniref:site-2 protease family protein n=1 Tax=Sporosarcina sp. ZBG7A TaxID=1582223 RepID=UPI00057A59B4|nr:site-2 protease family protein [Sporosarcina sp. ZBG7A]
MIETIIGYVIALFIFQPINVFIHENGHAFFVKIFGGNVFKIEIGIGEPLFNIGIIQVNKQFFMFGICRCEYNPTDPSSLNEKVKFSLIALGGIIFNLMTILILLAVKMNTTHNHFLDGYFFGFTGFLIVSALIPLTYSTGFKSDGLMLLNIWRKKTDKVY